MSGFDAGIDSKYIRTSVFNARNSYRVLSTTLHTLASTHVIYVESGAPKARETHRPA